MRINNNIMALNAHRQLSVNQMSMSKSLERLSSGLRINRAGDDAAGLAISEKMRAQIRGLQQAQRNAQDGISMIQTAEGALQETHSILQRMRELATQAANSTNTDEDRAEIQKEINQLTSEINRIGNTTEFNTQSLLKGDGTVSLEATGVSGLEGATSGGSTTHTQATQTVTFQANADTSASDGETLKFNVNGEELTITFSHDGSLALDTATVDTDSVTANEATINVNGSAGTNLAAATVSAAVTSALEAMIAENETLQGNYTVADGGGTVDLTAVTEANGGEFDGAAGYLGATTGAATFVSAQGTASVGTTTYTQATHAIDFSTVSDLSALVGTGFSIGDQQFEFYDADEGAYSGDATGINISEAINDNTTTTLASVVADQLNTHSTGDYTASVAGSVVTLTATADGEDGNDAVTVTDGGAQQSFTSALQIGANEGQSFTIEIGDMRAAALGITGDAGEEGFTDKLTVSDGTSSQLREAALDVSSHESASHAITIINSAIEKVSAQRSDLGAFQNRLEHTIANLGTSAENLQAAESRIRDLDMAAEMMTFTKNQILQQASTAMLAQANLAPQSVLQLLG